MVDPIQVERELEALRARVRGAQTPSAAANLTPLQKAICDVNANWHLSGRLPEQSGGPLLQRVIRLGRRIARRITIQVLDTIVVQQNTFNADVARALTELARENTALRQRVEELERQVAASKPTNGSH